MAPAADPLLSLEDLKVSFPAVEGNVSVLRGISFRMDQGETLGLVGESGCGKSLTALSILGLLPPPAQVTGGRVLFRGQEVGRLSWGQMRRLRGRQVGMVFQDPMACLDPVFTVGHQLGEALRAHESLSRAEVRSRSLRLLEEVGIPAPESRLGAYPAQLSGGLRQRTMIAMAIACRPALLIADEPTTALDVTIQAQIMTLLDELRQDLGMALLLITHDLGLAAHSVGRILVMYLGQVVEEAPTAELFSNPLHPYTQGLFSAMPNALRPGNGRRLIAIPGNVPHPLRAPSGCSFRDRCPRATAVCGEQQPLLEEKCRGHKVRCIRVAQRV